MTTDSVHIEKLGPNNYPDWKASMMFLLQAKKLWSAVAPETATDRETRASSKDTADKVADKSDEALGHIGLHVEKYLRCQVDEADSAREIWEKFEQDFQALNSSRLLLLRQQLTSLQKVPSEGVAKYVARAKDLMANLEAAGSSVTEAEVVLSVLAGLPEQYAMVVEILQMQDDLSFGKVLPKLLQVEQRVMPVQSAQQLGDTVQAYGANVRRCFYCNQAGHTKSQCNRTKADMQREGNARGATRPAVAF